MAEGAVADGGGRTSRQLAALKSVLLIFPVAALATGRIWHRPTAASQSWRLPGLHRAVPSVPLDEQVTTVLRRVSTCVHRIHMLDRSSDASAVRASAAGRARPRGPSRRRRTSRGGCGSSREAEQTSSVGRPRLRRSSDRLEGLEVAEVVAGEQEAAGLQVAPPAYSTTRPLCMPCERTSITWRPGSTEQAVPLGELGDRLDQPVEGVVGVVEPPGVDGDGQALLLDEGLAGVGGAQHPRQLALERRQPGRRPGRDDPAVGRGPPLVAVLPEEEQLPAGAADARRPPRPARRGPAPAARGGR